MARARALVQREVAAAARPVHGEWRIRAGEPRARVEQRADLANPFRKTVGTLAHEERDLAPLYAFAFTRAGARAGTVDAARVGQRARDKGFAGARRARKKDSARRRRAKAQEELS